VTPADPRLVFLERARARLLLVRAGDMNLNEAVTGLIDSIDRRWLLESIVGRRHLKCGCECDVLGRWERMRPSARNGGRRERRPLPAALRR
jgi:hypothetical protein